PLGAGGMGEVYKARDARLGRFVAVKVLPEQLARSGDALARFEREAKAVAALNHPNILGIHDVATDDGTSFVVMELLDGETLRTRRAFRRASGSETMAAILRDDPPEMEGTSRPIPPGLQRIVRHCLEKSPEQRFHSAHDVAFALQDLSSAEGTAPLTAPFARENRRATRAWAGVAAILVLAAGAAGWAIRGRPSALPAFRPLTHERGTLSAARFVPSSPEVIYSAEWAGGTSQWYSRRLDQPGTRAIAGSEGILLSVSANGEGVGLARPYLS